MKNFMFILLMINKILNKDIELIKRHNRMLKLILIIIVFKKKCELINTS